MIALLFFALMPGGSQSTPAAHPSPETCARAEKKIEGLQAAAKLPPDQRGGPVTLTQEEIESFFALSKIPKIPDGISGIHFEIHPGKQHATAIVDFDKYTANSKRPLNPLVELIVHGKRTINVEGSAFCPADHAGQYHLDFVALDDFKVEGGTIQFLMKWFVLGRYPKAEMDKAFVLPSNLKRVEIQEGRIVIQP